MRDSSDQVQPNGDETMSNLIYVAGPYGRRQGLSLEALNKNVTWANKYAAEMLYKGWIPFVPHNYHYVHILMAHPLDEDKWTDICMSFLPMCNAILMTAGWEHSEGSRRELAEAERLGLAVYYSIEEVPEV